MIHRFASFVWNRIGRRHPSTQCLSIQSNDTRSISQLKQYSLTFREEAPPSWCWRLFDQYLKYKSLSDCDRLCDLWSEQVIDLSEFTQSLPINSISVEQAREALMVWQSVTDAFHYQSQSEGVAINESEPVGASLSPGSSTEGSTPGKASGTTPSISYRPLHQSDSIEQAPSVNISSRELDPAFESLKNKILVHAENESSPQGVQGHSEQRLDVGTGLKGYRPTDINNSFHNGYLYYPVQTVMTERRFNEEGDPEFAEKVETVVIRSDRTLQRITKSERLKDGDIGHDVLRLTDGTLIHSPPKPNNHGTWSWDYIEQFLNEENERVSLNDCLKTVHQHLRSRIWLPCDSDYWLLSLTAVATYVQSIFESVPLLLLVGPAGSGKSELGMAMSEVSANATMIGQVTAPTMMRLIDESGGLCVIDDLESVGAGNGAGGREKFSEIAQVLKVSYKKSTATRMITNPRSSRTEIMNFFGIKIVSNTKGVDDILGSRMLHVHTRHIDKQMLCEFMQREPLSDEALFRVRNLLHTWAFENAAAVHRMNLSLVGQENDRDEEIAQPLRVIAQLTGNKTVESQVEEALAVQRQRKNANRDPQSVLEQVMESLAQSGYQQVTITHISLELRRLMDPGYSIDYHKEMPGWAKNEWIGRKLRELDMVNTTQSKRIRVRGHNLRVVTMDSGFIQSALSKLEDLSSLPVRSASDFCTDCSHCPFRHHDCELQSFSVS